MFIQIKEIFIQKKKSVLFTYSFLCIFIANAQMDIQLNTYWQNPYYITPAHINEVSSIVFTFAARKQWMNFNGAPVTFFGSASSFNENINSQFGLRIFNDKLGYTSITDASFTYAYNLRLGDSWWSNLGIGASYQRLDYDLSKIVFEGEEEFEVFSNLKQQQRLNADVGVEFFNYNFRFGLAGKNLMSAFKKDSLPIHINTNYIYGIYKQRTQNPVDFGGGIFGIQYANKYIVELNASVFFKTLSNKEMFHIGVLYRTPKEIGAIFGVNLSPSIYLSYNYNYNVGITSHRLGQTHEVMLTYKLDPVPVMRWEDIE